MKKRYSLLLCIGILMLLSGCTGTKKDNFIVDSEVKVEESIIEKSAITETEDDEEAITEKAVVIADCVEDKSDSIENESANGSGENIEECRTISIHTLAVNKDKKYRIVSGEYYGTKIDYKLYVCEEGDDNYDNPVYTFPDVREKNVAIGEYHDMYFIDQRDINSDGMIDIFSVARYMIDGKLYYDTRVYMGNGLEFVPDYEYMNELNSTYYLTTKEAHDYPIWEILYENKY